MPSSMWSQSRASLNSCRDLPVKTADEWIKIEERYLGATSELIRGREDTPAKIYALEKDNKLLKIIYAIKVPKGGEEDFKDLFAYVSRYFQILSELPFGKLECYARGKLFILQFKIESGENMVSRFTKFSFSLPSEKAYVYLNFMDLLRALEINELCIPNLEIEDLAFLKKASNGQVLIHNPFGVVDYTDFVLTNSIKEATDAIAHVTWSARSAAEETRRMHKIQPDTRKTCNIATYLDVMQNFEPMVKYSLKEQTSSFAVVAANLKVHREMIKLVSDLYVDASSLPKWNQIENVVYKNWRTTTTIENELKDLQETQWLFKYLSRAEVKRLYSDKSHYDEFIASTLKQIVASIDAAHQRLKKEIDEATSDDEHGKNSEPKSRQQSPDGASGRRGSPSREKNSEVSAAKPEKAFASSISKLDTKSEQKKKNAEKRRKTLLDQMNRQYKNLEDIRAIINKESES